MDGSAFKDMDLSKLFPWWLLVLAVIGFGAILVAGGLGFAWLLSHLHWV